MKELNPVWRICPLALSLGLLLSACAYRTLDLEDERSELAFRAAFPAFLSPAAREASEPWKGAKTQAQKGPVSLSLQEAVVMALRRNESFQIERLQPELNRTNEKIERAAFDPVLSASVTGGQGRDNTDVQGQPNEITDATCWL